MKYLLGLFFFLSFTLQHLQSYAQGCSDAGVCSVGSLGLVQYKYEKLPLDKVVLDQIETKDEDTEFYTTNNPSKKVGNDTTLVVTEKTQKDSATKEVNLNKSNSLNLDSLTLYTYRNKQILLRSPKYFFLYSTSYGLGDQSTTIITNQLEANVSLVNKKLYAQVKLPYVITSGKLATISALSDITLSMSYTAINKNKTNLTFVGGIKLPTNNADISKNNKPLPMVYQSSLGSTDALFGLKYRYQKWDLTLGYQHSFNTNKNNYLHDSISVDNAVYNSYFESKNLKRSDDGIVRINRNFLFKKVSASAGLLFIYHLANDSYTDVLGNRVTSKGSQGLTLNLNFSSIVPVSKKMDLIFIFANPIKTRDARPDGLTREFIVMAGLKYNVF